MIPKIIHYCWLSNDPIPNQIQECIDSWKITLPDFKIKKWDTTNFNIEKIQYVKEAYNNKKWAFAADYIRLYALYNEGGIYFDSDVFVLKRFDEFLNNRFFSAIECYPNINSDMQIQAAILGSEKNHPFLADCMEYYHNTNFINKDNSFNEFISPLLLAEKAEKYGFIYKNKTQSLEEGIMLYSIDEIAPIPDLVTKKTKLVHCCAGSWRWNNLNWYNKIWNQIKNFLNHILVILNLKRTWNWKKKFREMKNKFK